MYYRPGEPITGLYGSFIPLTLLSMLLSLVVVLFELRKKKRAEIKELWAESMTGTAA